jgi:hypothetical protein
MTADNPPGNISPESNLFPVVKFPIEGHTIWPNIMRLLTVGSIVGGVLLVFVLLLLVSDEQVYVTQHQIIRIILGLACFVIFELVIVRQLIIPMNGDYGRYRVNADKVEFYPLSTLGMKTLPRIETVPMADFKGIAIQPTIFRDGISRYYVTLVHPQQSLSIRLKLFNSHVDANAYAEVLAQALKTKVIRALNI